MQRYLKPLLFIAICLVSANAHAACTSPAGNEGDQVYNQTHKTMQFCDGTLWYSMKGGAVDKLGSLSCASGEVVKWNGTAWACASDAGLTAETDPQVAATTNGKWCVGNGSAVTCNQDTPSDGGTWVSRNDIFNEDVYGGAAQGNASDTCNGDTTGAYLCPVNITKSCVDSYKEWDYCGAATSNMCYLSRYRNISCVHVQINVKYP